MNIVEKILARASGKSSVSPDDVVFAYVDKVMMHDVSGPGVLKVFDKLKKQGITVDKLLLIYGWADFLNSEKSVESVYIFVDEEVHSKGMHGFLRKDLDAFGLGARSLSGWYGIIDPKEISYGCHSVSIRITYDNMYSEINLKKELCKNNLLS